MGHKHDVRHRDVPRGGKRKSGAHTCRRCGVGLSGSSIKKGKTICPKCEKK
jgi:uncharacterized Zn finger protein (UPF0148 family)